MAQGVQLVTCNIRYVRRELTPSASRHGSCDPPQLSNTAFGLNYVTGRTRRNSPSSFPFVAITGPSDLVAQHAGQGSKYQTPLAQRQRCKEYKLRDRLVFVNVALVSQQLWHITTLNVEE
jgi:hypothetical protein